MIVSDFLDLEMYFGSENAVLYYEDIIKRYGQARAEQALNRGDLTLQNTYCAISRGKLMAFLSDKGRRKAMMIDTQSLA